MPTIAKTLLARFSASWEFIMHVRSAGGIIQRNHATGEEEASFPDGSVAILGFSVRIKDQSPKLYNFQPCSRQTGLKKYIAVHSPDGILTFPHKAANEGGYPLVKEVFHTQEMAEVWASIALPKLSSGQYWAAIQTTN